jgi:hypothetical protein
MLWHDAGARVKSESSPHRPSDTAWESYPALFHRPLTLCGHPRHCTTLCGKASVNSLTLCHLLPYSRRAAPSKEGSRTLEKGTDTCPTPTRDNTMMSD